MFYGAFPPEFNSGRMYAGPGAESMVAAAAAWDTLASELQSTVSAYSSVIDTLSSGPWVGPSSVSMVAAVTPYLAWMQTTAAQAAHTSNQATAAAAAYETAFGATVPPEEVAANRTQLVSLVATNIVGQNTAAIAATEAQYAEMWAQDALAMDTYVAEAEAATTQLTAFTQAPATTNGSGSTTQAAAVSAASATPAANAAATLGSIIPPFTPAAGPLGYLAGLANWYQALGKNLLEIVPNGSAWYAAVYNAVKIPLGITTTFNDIGLLINFPLSQWLKFAPPVAYGALPKDALGAGLGALGFGRGTLYNAVSPVAASLGRGTLVGSLTVPPSWASATPAIRTVAAALTAAGPEAVPAAALGEGGLLSSMSVAGMLGSAFGAGAPTVANRAGVRGRLTPLKELKDGTSPEKLKKVVAQISEKPESVQHHNVDQEGLDALLEQLARKPGIHAVHLSKGKPKVVPSEAQMT
ncbi:PPE family protein [Mycobacterium sp. HUMS_1102779]|uniref:PPE family protein n=1 Tax=Mycobacterium sp. HUMS_1102779 TaxID=3383487 RepID=UPI00389A3FDC